MEITGLAHTRCFARGSCRAPDRAAQEPRVTGRAVGSSPRQSFLVVARKPNSSGYYEFNVMLFRIQTSFTGSKPRLYQYTII